MDEDSDSTSGSDINDDDFRMLQEGLKGDNKLDTIEEPSFLDKVVSFLNTDKHTDLSWFLNEWFLIDNNLKSLSQFFGVLAKFDEAQQVSLLKLVLPFISFREAFLDVLNETPGLLKNYKQTITEQPLINDFGLYWSGESFIFNNETIKLMKNRKDIHSNKDISLEVAIKIALYEVSKKNIMLSKDSKLNFYIGLSSFKEAISSYPLNLDLWFLYFHYLLLHLDIYDDSSMKILISMKLFIHSNLLYTRQTFDESSSHSQRSIAQIMFLSFSNLALRYKTLDASSEWKDMLKNAITKRSLSLESLLTSSLESSSMVNSELRLYLIELYFYSYSFYLIDSKEFQNDMVKVVDYVSSLVYNLALKPQRKFEFVTQLKLLIFKRGASESNGNYDLFLKEIEDAHEYLTLLRLCELNGESLLFKKTATQALKDLKDDFTTQRIISNKLMSFELKYSSSIDSLFRTSVTVNKIFISHYRFGCFQARQSRKLKLKENGSEIMRLMQKVPGHVRNKSNKAGFKRKADNSGISKAKVEKMSKTGTEDHSKLRSPEIIKLFLFNLNYKSDEATLASFLADLNLETTKIQILKGRNRGRSVVHFCPSKGKTIDELSEVIRSKEFMGRTLEVQPYKTKNERKLLNTSKATTEKVTLVSNRIVVKNISPSTIVALEKYKYNDDTVAKELSEIAPILAVTVAANKVTVFVDYTDEDCVKKVVQYYEMKKLSDSESPKVEIFGKQEKVQAVLSLKSVQNTARKQILGREFMPSENYDKGKMRNQTDGRKSNDYFKSLLTKGAHGR